MVYLKVFIFQNSCDPDVPGKRGTNIVRSQEIPEYENTYFLRDGSSPVDGTVLVIDDYGLMNIERWHLYMKISRIIGMYYTRSEMKRLLKLYERVMC